jgi:hypothetical protein
MTKVWIDMNIDGSYADHWHELHDCACPVCLGPAEHRIVSNGYEDIECMGDCDLVWLRGEPTDPEYVIDKRPDKSKRPCNVCGEPTIH